MKNFITYQLALEFYRSLNFNRVNGPLKDQLHRAALSIALNLAEGSGKDGKDRVRFFKIAMGSLRETQACLDILDWKNEAATADKLGGYIYKLIQNPGRHAG